MHQNQYKCNWPLGTHSGGKVFIGRTKVAQFPRESRRDQERPY